LLPWHNQIRGGDSGSPQFFLVNGDPILMASHATVADAANISTHTAQINTAMNSLAGTVDTYALSHPTLSAFNTY
jgi:hypothetical protein